jgi:hypothetical protein
MKLKNSIKIIALSAIASALFVGCGDSGDSTPATATVETGTFIDAPVQGLKYVTASQNGYTNANGEFQYVAGEEVEFFLGNLSLGKATAGALMTPYTLSGSNTQMATNIALLVQNFDNDRTDAILNILALKDYNLSDFNISDTNANLETKLTTLLATGDFQTLRGGTDFGLIDAVSAKSAMDDFIATNSVNYDKKFTQAYLDAYDFYSISSDETKIVRLRDGHLYYAGDSYEEDDGTWYQGAGFDGVFDDYVVGNYTITDGIITNTFSSGGVVSIKITNIMGDYIEVYMQEIGGSRSATEKWYTNKEAAIEAIDLGTTLSNKKITLQGTDVTMDFLDNGTWKRYGNDGDGVFDCVGTYEVNINVVSFEVTQCTGESGPATGTFTFNSLPVQVGTVFHHDVTWDGGSDAGNDIIATFGSI